MANDTNLNGYNGTVRNFGFGEWHLVLGSKQQHGTPLDPTVFCTAFRIQMTLPIKWFLLAVAVRMSMDKRRPTVVVDAGDDDHYYAAVDDVRMTMG